jgi:hypothetical protein
MTDIPALNFGLYLVAFLVLTALFRTISNVGSAVLIAKNKFMTNLVFHLLAGPAFTVVGIGVNIYILTSLILWDVYYIMSLMYLVAIVLSFLLMAATNLVDRQAMALTAIKETVAAWVEYRQPSTRLLVKWILPAINVAGVVLIFYLVVLATVPRDLLALYLVAIMYVFGSVTAILLLVSRLRMLLGNPKVHADPALRKSYFISAFRDFYFACFLTWLSLEAIDIPWSAELASVYGLSITWLTVVVLAVFGGFALCLLAPLWHAESRAKRREIAFLDERAAWANRIERVTVPTSPEETRDGLQALRSELSEAKRALDEAVAEERAAIRAHFERVKADTAFSLIPGVDDLLDEAIDGLQANRLQQADSLRRFGERIDTALHGATVEAFEKLDAAAENWERDVSAEKSGVRSRETMMKMILVALGGVWAVINTGFGISAVEILQALRDL